MRTAIQDEDGSNPLDGLLERLADCIVAKLAKRTDAAVSRYADAKNNPIGTERAFLDAARRGDFPTFKRGRRVSALWVDVQSYVEGRSRAARSKVPEIDTDVVALAGAGVRLRSKGASR